VGIIFVDELDKVVASQESHGADVSRQGVQRDLLPIVEGTTVQTRYGYVRTDHILFIAAGAFHRAKPSDGIMGIGSGGNYAVAAARALVAHSRLSAVAIVRKSRESAAGIDGFTNTNIVVEEMACEE